MNGTTPSVSKPARSISTIRRIGSFLHMTDKQLRAPATGTGGAGGGGTHEACYGPPPKETARGGRGFCRTAGAALGHVPPAIGRPPRPQRAATDRGSAART